MTRAANNQTTIARYIAGHDQLDVPSQILEAARLCLADWMAVAIGAGGEPAGRIVRERVASWGSTGKSSVLYGGTAAAPFAALANGTLAHCLDFDDTHVGAIVHTSAPVWATTLALGEAIGASERAMLRAFVVGFEVAARAGGGLGQAVTSRGFHSTGVWGRIGAAAAAAALMRLDAEQAAHALGAAATQASGLTASFGTMAKPFHAGKAAMDGILAAELAAAGFTAAVDVLESGGGLDRALIQDGSAKITPADFGHWEILQNSIKPYAACHLVHPSADAARALGITPDRVARLTARVSPLCMQMTGEADGRPQSSLAAKFDLKYCIALALHGRALSAGDFLEPWVPEAAILETAARIAAVADQATGFAAARLEADLVGGGSKSSAIATAKGHPGNPMTWDDMWSKFEGLVSRPLGIEAAADLFDHIRDFGSGHALDGIQAALPRLSTRT